MPKNGSRVKVSDAIVLEGAEILLGLFLWGIQELEAT
jgi:hypothetical protein